MEARLEPPSTKYRGVMLISQNMEEKEILLNIWNKGGQPVSLSRQNSNICIIIAPTPEREDRKER
jgi:hypothetical protein